MLQSVHILRSLHILQSVHMLQSVHILQPVHVHEPIQTMKEGVSCLNVARTSHVDRANISVSVVCLQNMPEVETLYPEAVLISVQ